MEFIELIIASSGSATFIASTVYILLKNYKKEIDGRLEVIASDINSLRNDIKDRIDKYNVQQTEVKIEIAKMSSSIDMLMAHRPLNGGYSKTLDD